MKNICRFAMLAAVLCVFSVSARANSNSFAGAFAHPRVPEKKMELGASVDPQPDPQGTSHSVTLTWNAPSLTGTTCTLSGYNVKRSNATGTEVTIASPTTTTYVDTAVSAGQKFFYVVTATFGTTCTESLPSNEVSVTVPLDRGPAPTNLAGSGS